MPTFCSPPIHPDEIAASLELLTAFVGEYREVTFSSVLAVSGKPSSAFPLSMEWRATQPRGFSLGGMFPRPSMQVFTEWDAWCSNNPAWGRLPAEGGVDVWISDQRFVGNGKAALWSIEWVSSYRFGDHVAITPPLVFMGRVDPEIVVAAWQAGAAILNLPVRATPAARGYRLEATGGRVIPIWPDKFPSLFDGLCLRIKPWLTKEEFYERVFALHEEGGRCELCMFASFSVSTQSEAEDDDALKNWVEPSLEDLIAGWDSFQHWNSLQKKNYSLYAAPVSMAGYRQMSRLNDNRPAQGDLLDEHGGEDNIVFGVCSQEEEYLLYLGTSGALPFKWESLEAKMGMKFLERELYLEV